MSGSYVHTRWRALKSAKFFFRRCKTTYIYYRSPDQGQDPRMFWRMPPSPARPSRRLNIPDTFSISHQPTAVAERSCFSAAFEELFRPRVGVARWTAEKRLQESKKTSNRSSLENACVCVRSSLLPVLFCVPSVGASPAEYLRVAKTQDIFMYVKVKGTTSRHRFSLFLSFSRLGLHTYVARSTQLIYEKWQHGQVILSVSPERPK